MNKFSAAVISLSHALFHVLLVLHQRDESEQGTPLVSPKAVQSHKSWRIKRENTLSHLKGDATRQLQLIKNSIKKEETVKLGGFSADLDMGYYYLRYPLTLFTSMVLKSSVGVKINLLYAYMDKAKAYSEDRLAKVSIF